MHLSVPECLVIEVTFTVATTAPVVFAEICSLNVWPTLARNDDGASNVAVVPTPNLPPSTSTSGLPSVATSPTTSTINAAPLWNVTLVATSWPAVGSSVQRAVMNPSPGTDTSCSSAGGD